MGKKMQKFIYDSVAGMIKVLGNVETTRRLFVLASEAQQRIYQAEHRLEQAQHEDEAKELSLKDQLAFTECLCFILVCINLLWIGGAILWRFQ
jgi:hypothetical protein